MKKLVQGIIDFRRNVRPSYAETFSRLALGQSPDTLFIACSDSRVVPNLFASTDPGDLFVIRNVANLVPRCGGPEGLSSADQSEAAAIEFAVQNLKVRDIIVCGHSECGGMQALLNGREKLQMPNLSAWLRHGEDALKKVRANPDLVKDPQAHNILSKTNVLLQVEHLCSYPLIQQKIQAKELRIHAWWFELASASVFYFDGQRQEFVEIEESRVDHILKSMDGYRF